MSIHKLVDRELVVKTKSLVFVEVNEYLITNLKKNKICLV